MTEKNTFYNMLKSNAQNRPDAVAIVYDTMKVTYAKFLKMLPRKLCIFRNMTERELQYSDLHHTDGLSICLE